MRLPQRLSRDLSEPLLRFRSLPIPSGTQRRGAHGRGNAERALINTGERYVFGSAFAQGVQRRSTGSEYKSLYCLPKYCLCGSSLRRSDTGSPNTRYLCRPRSSRTTEPVRPPRVLARSLPMQDQPQPPKSCVSSSFELHAGLSNTPRRLSLFHYIRGRSPSIGSYFTITVEATSDVTIEVGMIAAAARGPVKSSPRTSNWSTLSLAELQ